MTDQTAVEPIPTPPPPAADGPPLMAEDQPAIDVGPLAKLGGRKMADIEDNTPLSEKAQPLLKRDLSARDMIEELVKAKLWVDACATLAHAIPKREGVWWAAVVARRFLPAEPDRKVVLTLEAAEAWVRKPTEENRQLALARGSAIRTTGAPSAWAAVAAGWSTGSMAPKAEVDIPAEPWMTGTAVFAAVMHAAGSVPEAFYPGLHAALVCGLDIADGGNGRPQGRDEAAAGSGGL
ncbi:MAG: hypothetical protein KDA64_15590 [Rhodospirillaceae bacterium]|nr:hypothetical protein [Rhodospirillaceae bacterium]